MKTFLLLFLLITFNSHSQNWKTIDSKYEDGFRTEYQINSDYIIKEGFFVSLVQRTVYEKFTLEGVDYFDVQFFGDLKFDFLKKKAKIMRIRINNSKGEEIMNEDFDAEWSYIEPGSVSDIIYSYLNEKYYK